MISSTLAVRTIFAELRRTIGPAASGVGLLNFATVVVNFYRLKTRPEDPIDLDTDLSRRKWAYFEECEIDIAMQDGGWRVYEYEYSPSRTNRYEAQYFLISDNSLFYVDSLEVTRSDLYESESLQWLLVNQHYSDFIPPSAIDIADLATMVFYENE